MFAEAIQKHHEAAGPPRKLAQTLSQQLFPSSSPTTSQQPSQSNKVLRPNSSSVVNVPRTQSRFDPVNPLKRTLTEANKMGNSFSRMEPSGKRQETAVLRQGSVSSNNNTLKATREPSVYGGVVGKLHEAVYFDENDFVDDADLDLDEDFTLNHAHILPTISHASNVEYPPLPGRDSQSYVPSSNLPVSWSSSPFEHKSAHANPITGKGESQPTNRVELTQDEEVNSCEAAPRPSKRRTLPWLSQQGTESNMVNKGPPAHVQAIIDRKKNAQERKLTALAQSSTPLPKGNQESSQPWNQTASAVKDGQKKHRQEANVGTKRIKSGQGSEETLAQARIKKLNTIEKMSFSDEQKRILNLVVDVKKSVFFTGSAGTGKSVLMRGIIEALKAKYKKETDRVAITASTGLAACNVGGVTLHSFAGIGLGKEAVPELVKKIKKNPKAKNRWMRTKVLIIDEISMVDGDLFDKLENIARLIRNNGRPFGGIQLIITGDFFQLPPVPDQRGVAKFAFDAATWSTSIEHTIGLSNVFRQKDPVFANMLNEMRLGKLTPKSIAAFHKLTRPMAHRDDITATELFPTRNEVENANGLRMRNLGGRAIDFDAIDGGTITDVAHRTKLLSNCMAPPKITLKKGAQVMLIKNIDDSLVNGSVGKVMAFMDEQTFDHYREDEAEFQAVESMDLDEAEMTESRKKLKALINKTAFESKKWPLVRFQIADGTTRDLLCQNEEWKIELPNGEIQASRLQTPLILAWALSIHKAQGQTLEKVKVDLGKIFEKGQAYVALSRATCQEGLQIIRFDPKKVMAHDRVRTFYDNLYNVNLLQHPVGEASKHGRRQAKDNGGAHMTGGTSFYDNYPHDDEEALAEIEH